MFVCLFVCFTIKEGGVVPSFSFCCNFSDGNRYKYMNKNRKKLIEAKALCNDAKVGEEITCPSCGSTHVKKSYQSVFCKTKGGTKCKDNFWNNVDPSKRCNTTRMSPASASWMAEQKEMRESYGVEDYDPGDSEYWDNKDF